MTARKNPENWFWSYDIKQTDISSLLTSGTRLLCLSNYRNAGRQRFAALLHIEPGPATHYVFDLSVRAAIESVQGNTQRPISITVDTYDSLPKFSLVMEDSVASTSALKMDIDEAGLKALVNQHQGITDLTTYTLNGKRLFAAIVEPRSIPSWLFVGVTASELDQQLRKLKAALIRMRSYQDAGQRLYVAIAEPASSDTRTWWYTDLAPDEVAGKLEDHKAYPIDLDAMDYDDRVRFTVVMCRTENQ